MDRGAPPARRTTDSGEVPLLSVSQFAARERVTRARVLQLLAARRIPGARRLGHLWAIPAASAIDRRRPGRPRGRRGESAPRLLRELARKYVWWLSPADVAARPDLAITQTMELGDFGDQRRLEATFGRDRLAEALRGAQAGRLSARSWTYWHYRLGLAQSGSVPPLPQRQLK
jgi:hypothetical protein